MLKTLYQVSQNIFHQSRKIHFPNNFLGETKKYLLNMSYIKLSHLFNTFMMKI